MFQLVTLVSLCSLFTVLDAVDFLTKKKFFDKVMHIQRLEEELVILAREVRQHWEFLKRREQTLSCLSSSTEGKPLR